MNARPPDQPARVRAAPYDRYAAVYDEIGQREFGERIAEATLRYLAESGRSPARVVDLACGTGAATLVFAAHGLRVTGVDRSAAMLAAARRAFAEAGLPGQFIECDLRELPNEIPADLVTCFYDSLNYILSADDLCLVFAGVRRIIAPDGLFVFDLNTREKLSTTWNNSCFVAVDRADLFGIYQSWYEPEASLSPLLLTFFVREDDGAWSRFDEEHVERAYELTEVSALLTAAGFEVEAMLDYRDRAPAFGPGASEHSHRVVFIAKPVGEERSSERP